MDAKIKKECESLYFGVYNLKECKRKNACGVSLKSYREHIKLSFDILDALSVKKEIQNKILHAANNDKFYFFDNIKLG